MMVTKIDHIDGQCDRRIKTYIRINTTKISKVKISIFQTLRELSLVVCVRTLFLKHLQWHYSLPRQHKMEHMFGERMLGKNMFG